MHIIPATPVHALRVAEEMRECDRQEVRAASGHSPGVALLLSMQASEWRYAALDSEERPFAIFGVGHSEGPIGSPWMLATNRLYDNRKWVARVTKDIVAAMHEVAPVLLNYVDARNTASLRWLKWAGFEFAPARPYGVEQLPFHLFTKVSHV